MKVNVISETKQEFNGVVYYKCGNYFQRKGVRLHRIVWEFHNGAIPHGYHVHHKDENKSKNDIDNLELMESASHLRKHMSKPERVAKSRELIKIASQEAKKWHGSTEGKEWHSKHAKVTMANKPVKTYKCDCCGVLFETKHSYAVDSNKFCSNNCKSNFRRAQGIDNVKSVCGYCGKEYYKNRYSKGKCCSSQCASNMRWGK